VLLSLLRFRYLPRLHPPLSETAFKVYFLFISCLKGEI